MKNIIKIIFKYNNWIKLKKLLQQLDEVKKITSLSFKKLNHTKKWSEDDTKLFYKGLEIFGLDFSFLEIILKPRTRNKIKKKYHKEIKINKSQIEKCLNSKKNISKMIEILNNYKNEINEKDDLKGKNISIEKKNISKMIEILNNYKNEIKEKDDLKGKNINIENMKEKIAKINKEKNEIYKKIINNNKSNFNAKNIEKIIDKFSKENLNYEINDFKENLNEENNYIEDYEKEEENENLSIEDIKKKENNNKLNINKKLKKNNESDNDSNRTISEGEKEEAKRNAFVNNILKNF